MKIYIVNGMPTSGKTTFEQFSASYIGTEKCKIISTIDCVKMVAKICGWKGEKDSKSRKFLSDLKDLLTNYNDLPFEYINKEINKSAQDTTFFIDCREPDEIERLRDALKAKTILIRRSDIENINWDNHADSEVLNYNYDYIVENNGTLQDLAECVYTLAQEEQW